MAATILFNSVTCKQLFAQFSCSIEPGSSVLLITSREDESSALLRLITGLDFPASGFVQVMGQSVADLSADQLYQLRRRIGAIPFTGGLVSNLKMWENITLPLSYQSRSVNELLTTDTLSCLEQLGYNGEVMVLPAHLTLYEKRITAFARAILQQPQLMIYCNSLDGISHNSRARLAKAALDFHNATKDRTSLFMTSSMDVAKELDVDVCLSVHELSPTARTA